MRETVSTGRLPSSGWTSVIIKLEQETVQNKRFILMQMFSHCQRNHVITSEKGCIKLRDRDKGR